MKSVLDSAVNADKVMVVPVAVRENWMYGQHQYRRQFWVWITPWFLLAVGIILGFLNPLITLGVGLIVAGWLCYSIPYRNKFMSVWKEVRSEYFSHVNGFLQSYKIRLGYQKRDKLETFIHDGEPGESIVITDTLQSTFKFWVDDCGNIQSVLMKSSFLHKGGSLLLGWDSLPEVVTLRQILPHSLAGKVSSLESKVNLLSSLNHQLTVEEVHVHERASRELETSVNSLVSLHSTDMSESDHVADFERVVDLLLADVSVPLQRVTKSSADSLRLQTSFLQERSGSGMDKNS